MGTNFATIRVIASVQSGSQKMGKSRYVTCGVWSKRGLCRSECKSVNSAQLYYRKRLVFDWKKATIIRVVAPVSLVVKNFAIAPVPSCRSTFMASALKENHVIGSNEYKSIISTRIGLSVSRPFYNMTVSAVTRTLV